MNESSLWSDMDDPLFDQPEQPRRRLPVWPFAVGAAFLLVAGAILSFYVPMLRAQRFLGIIEEFGSYEAEYDHPQWTALFLGDEQFHPWFDKLIIVEVFDPVADDAFLDDLRAYGRLEWLRLNVSYVSDQHIATLAEFPELGFLELIDDGRALPLDWIQRLPRLDTFYPTNLAIGDADWEAMFTHATIETVGFENCTLSEPIGALAHHQVRAIEFYDAILTDEWGERCRAWQISKG